MRVAHFEDFGPEVIKKGKIEVPNLGEGEVLVKIRASCRCFYKDMIPHSFPAIPDWKRWPK